MTRSPAGEWVTQQLREATPCRRPKYLIHDRDKKYGPRFAHLLAHTGIEPLLIPVQTPQANGTCERFLGSLKWECLDYMLILHGCQLQHLVREYVEYYNQARPHQGIEQQIPDWYEQGYPFATTGPVIATSVLNGLHHAYSRSAYLH